MVYYYCLKLFKSLFLETLLPQAQKARDKALSLQNQLIMVEQNRFKALSDSQWNELITFTTLKHADWLRTTKARWSDHVKPVFNLMTGKTANPKMSVNEV